MSFGAVDKVLRYLFGGPVKAGAASTGQALIRQADGSWAGGSAGGTSSATYTVTDALILGAATTSGVRLDVSSGTLRVREGDNSDNAHISASYVIGSNGVFQGATVTGLTPVCMLTATGAVVRSNKTYAWSNSTTDANQPLDTGLARDSAGVVKVTDGSTGGGKIMLSEVTAPTGTANSVILYAEDNGSGKTRLMAIFGSGAAQQVAIEP